MKLILKTWKKATYFEGKFQLRERTVNWANPIQFPIVFKAYGRSIKNGNWQTCTAINTPDYVIKKYFDNIGKEKSHSMYELWKYCKELSQITWEDVEKNKENVIYLLKKANNELLKLEILK